MSEDNAKPRVYGSATRVLKNIRVVRKFAPDLLPDDLPLKRIGERIPLEVIKSLHLRKNRANASQYLSRFLSEEVVSDLLNTFSHFPQEDKLTGLFQGTLHFVQLHLTAFSDAPGEAGRTHIPGTPSRKHIPSSPIPLTDLAMQVPPVSDHDMTIAIQYATLAANPIQRYASLYGPNAISVDPNKIDYHASVSIDHIAYSHQVYYDFEDMEGWADDVRAQNNIPDTDCLVFFNPPGVHNRWCDQMKAGGYHWTTEQGPFILFYGGQTITIDDAQYGYALPLSHEIAEMVVNPNPIGHFEFEVCDLCSSDGTVYLAYFERDTYIKTVKWDGGPNRFAAKTKINFPYTFFICAIAHPGFWAIPDNSFTEDTRTQYCSYGPPP